MTGSDSPDDLLPEQRSPARVERRRRQARRRWLLIGGAAALVVLLVVIVVNAVGDDGGAPAPAAKAVSEARRSRGSSTSTSTKSGRAPDSTTSTATDGSTATSGPPSASSAVPGHGSVPAEPPGTGGAVTVTEDPGACRFEADELFDSGHVVNTTGEEVAAEVEVTWVDSTGELDSSSDLQAVGPGETAEWSISTPISDPPQGLTCRVALI